MTAQCNYRVRTTALRAVNTEHLGRLWRSLTSKAMSAKQDSDNCTSLWEQIVFTHDTITKADIHIIQHSRIHGWATSSSNNNVSLQHPPCTTGVENMTHLKLTNTQYCHIRHASHVERIHQRKRLMMVVLVQKLTQ